jgi:LuxR family maltose regulon positive regulatory protein
MSTLPAFVALGEGRLVDAERGFTAALEAHGQQLDLQGQWTELRLRGAELRLRLGRTHADAAALLLPLFERHAGDADIAALLLDGLDTLRALAQAPWGDALSAEQRAALTRWADRAAALRPRAQPVAAATSSTSPSISAASVLSEREAEVLARLAAGDSNKLIARAFDLSPHTVKRHVANILDKLDLRSRGQAAAWYHERHA